MSNDVTIQIKIYRSRARKIDVAIERLGQSSDDVIEFTADFFEKAARRELTALINHAGGKIISEKKRKEY